MHRLSNMPEDSIHAEILREKIADAQERPSWGNWAGGIVMEGRKFTHPWQPIRLNGWMRLSIVPHIQHINLYNTLHHCESKAAVHAKA